MNNNDKYTVADSPFKSELESCFQEIIGGADRLHDADDRTAVENALYMSVTKRMRGRVYNGEPAAYLSGLLADLHDAENEFEQVCYFNSSANDAFFTIKGAIIALLSNK